ncbi:MAG: 2Fe-2S iron-sulfur cluster binding domain-containing protein [Flavobacteriales bacterium]|nr:2Fe-2S iron-sulfur cluster binding domain-containing protein [Flavobacteriales bacterium]
MSIIFIATACAVLLSLVVRWMLKGPTRSRIHITINGGRVLEVGGGHSLYHTLEREGIVLASTCGGKGSCAQCRCRVVKGGGRITEREQPYFSRAEVARKWRLACQVKVYGDMTVELPGTALHGGTTPDREAAHLRG